MPGNVSLNDIVDVFSCCILNWSALTVMLPAFFLAGAIAVFVPAPLVLRHFGGTSRRWLAYTTAAVSGCVLSVCSCNVVPLFTSIYRRGAGLGPAVAFLYAGPAINIVSLIFTFKVIGWRVAIWRAVATPIIAVLVGALMSFLFRREEAARQEAVAAQAALGVASHPTPRLGVFFGLLLTMVLVGSATEDLVRFMTWPVRISVTAALGLTLALLSLRWFEREELKEWLVETWKLARVTVPVLVVSVLAIGYIAQAIPLTTLQQLGLTSRDGNSLGSALTVSTFGALMYFPMLTEIAFAKAFMKLNDMPPSLGLIVMLTGAGLSLPGHILIWRAMGPKKLAVYVSTIIVLAALAGLFFGHYVGKYICPCTE